jgi:phosphatidylcholine synthase
MSERSTAGRLLSFCVHLFTAGGAVLGTFALIAIASERLDAAALLMLAALFIDALDGTLARAVRVSLHTPEIDGRRLDDIVDYLNFVIVPAVFLWGAGSVLHPGWLAAPVLASAYGFSRRDAKTDDGFFLGFPSYWNILALYLWLLGVGPLGGTLWLVGLSVAVFIPLKYLYPSQVQPLRLRFWLGVGALLWTGVLILCVVWPHVAAPYFGVELSLLYPAWYMWLSFRRGGFRGNPAARTAASENDEK